MKLTLTEEQIGVIVEQIRTDGEMGVTAYAELEVNDLHIDFNIGAYMFKAYYNVRTGDVAYTYSPRVGEVSVDYLYRVTDGKYEELSDNVEITNEDNLKKAVLERLDALYEEMQEDAEREAERANFDKYHNIKRL